MNFLRLLLLGEDLLLLLAAEYGLAGGELGEEDGLAGGDDFFGAGILLLCGCPVSISC